MDKAIINFLMVVGLIFILMSGSMIYFELRGAKRFCNSINGNYKFKFSLHPSHHYCNDNILIQYTDGWDFPRPELNNINISIPQ